MSKRDLFFIVSLIFVSSLIIFTIKHNKQHIVSTEVDNCIGKAQCLEDFFQKYTVQNGLDKTLQNYQNLISQNPRLMSECHYIFHGMGHGQFINTKESIGQSFSNIEIADYVKKNLAICVSGYYHGVIEEATKNVFDEKLLTKKLESACKEVEDKNLDKLNCYHGVGHAVLINLSSTEKALNICDRITSEKDMIQSCHSGVFMEMAKDNELKELTQNKNEINSGMMSLKICDSLSLKYQAECYNQQSYLLKELSTDQGFLDNLNKCQKIKDQVERIYCVRLYEKK